MADRSDLRNRTDGVPFKMLYKCDSILIIYIKDKLLPLQTFSEMMMSFKIGHFMVDK